MYLFATFFFVVRFCAFLAPSLVVLRCCVDPGPVRDGRETSLPALGVDSGPGEAGSGVVRGAPVSKYMLVAIQTSAAQTNCLSGLSESVFRAEYRLDSNLESLKIGFPAGRRTAGGTNFMFSCLASGRNPARKPDFWLGSSIAQRRVRSPSIV